MDMEMKKKTDGDEERRRTEMEMKMKKKIKNSDGNEEGDDGEGEEEKKKKGDGWRPTLRSSSCSSWKWRKFWGILYRESTGVSAHLDLLEGSRPASTEKTRKAEKTRRCSISLSECVHVAEASGEATCPKETSPFLLETTEKGYLLAAPTMEAVDWVRDLCQQAFLKDSKDCQGRPGKKLPEQEEEGEPPSSLTMADNPLYSSAGKGTKSDFPVVVVATPASERIRIWGRFLLAARSDALVLCEHQKGTVLHSWPYQFLRRFGHDKVLFSFEAGRRCDSGEGTFEFATKQGSEILQAIEDAIRAQKDSQPLKEACPAGSYMVSSGAASLPAGAIAKQGSLSGKGPMLDQKLSFKTLGTKTLSTEPSGQTMPTRDCLAPRADCVHLSDSHPRQNLRATEGSSKTSGQAVPESVYSEPFDAISRPFRGAEGSRCPLPLPSPPISYGGTHGSGLEPSCAGQDHIYDNPEVLLPEIYDEPQELKGEAWKLQAEDVVGYEYPYSPSLDDYSVPRMLAFNPAAQARDKWPGRNQL